jgi:hypothetical protein
MLILPNSLAIEIYNDIRNALSSGVVLQFNLKHNGKGSQVRDLEVVIFFFFFITRRTTRSTTTRQ